MRHDGPATIDLNLSSLGFGILCIQIGGGTAIFIFSDS